MRAATARRRALHHLSADAPEPAEQGEYASGELRVEGTPPEQPAAAPFESSEGKWLRRTLTAEDAELVDTYETARREGDDATTTRALQAALERAALQYLPVVDLAKAFEKSKLKKKEERLPVGNPLQSLSGSSLRRKRP